MFASIIGATCVSLPPYVTYRRGIGEIRTIHHIIMTPRRQNYRSRSMILIVANYSPASRLLASFYSGFLRSPANHCARPVFLLLITLTACANYYPLRINTHTRARAHVQNRTVFCRYRRNDRDNTLAESISLALLSDIDYID
jgi:hypothetical protein